MKGVVAAGHELTARAGVEMLEMGGNAFDAAVAATFASFATEPMLTSPGGGGFLLARSGGADPSVALYDFFTDTPGRNRANKEVKNFFGLDVEFTPGTVQTLHIGESSAAVPGTMAGLDMVHRELCTLPLDTLLAPAARYASVGVELNPLQATFIRILEPLLSISGEVRELYMPGGEPLGPGERVRNEKLAATFEHLATEGLGSFYHGDVAEKILDRFGGEGLITAEDLKGYRVEKRKPLEVSYRGRTIYTNPPPSSGGTLIGFALKLLEAYDLGPLGHNTVEYLELLGEVMRITNEARSKEFDQRVHEEGIAEQMLSPRTVEVYAGKLSQDLRAKSNPPGEAGPGLTTQVSVVDGRGNAASVTTSIGIGCGFMIPGTGIMMNNMLGERDLNPLGYHTRKPGTRIPSMMAPTIAVKDSEPELVLGSGGSKRIRSAILQVLVNVMDFFLPLAEAVNAPRAHWERGIYDMEGGMPAGVMDGLEEKGYHLKRWDGKHMYFGGVHTVMRTPGGFAGAGDERRAGAAGECL